MIFRDGGLSQNGYDIEAKEGGIDGRDKEREKGRGEGEREGTYLHTLHLPLPDLYL